jgi:phosphoserine phosphatase
VAFLDWDNTLYRGITLVAWSDALSADGLLPQGCSDQISDVVSAHLHGGLTYAAMAHRAPQIYAEGLTGTSRDEVRGLAPRFVASDRWRLWSATSYVLGALANHNVDAVILSGAPEEVLEAYSQILPFSSYRGLAIGVKGGVYTGEIVLNPAEEKVKRSLVSGFTSEVALAIGDSEADRPLFESAKARVVVDNPNLLAENETTLHLKSASYDRAQLERFISRVG